MQSRHALKLTALLALTASLSVNADIDKWEWLEAVESEASLSWVEKHNQATAEQLEDPLYNTLYSTALEVLNQEGQLSGAYAIGDYYFELKKTEDNPRGVLIRSPNEAFLAGEAQWETVLDVDALAESEGKPWVYHGLNCYQNDPAQCLVSLSPGGTDADEVREFNALTGEFINDGFYLPLAKSSVSWVDANTWIIATDFGDDSLTDSGYPRKLKIHNRGDDLAEAKLIYVGNRSSVSSGAYTLGPAEDSHLVIFESTSFWTRNYYLSDPDTNLITQLKIPNSAILLGRLAGQWVISLKKEWQLGEYSYPAGAIVLASNEQLRLNGELFILAESSREQIIEDTTVTDQGILIVSLRDVVAEAHWYAPQEDGVWTKEQILLPDHGTVSLQSIDENSGKSLLRFESFLVPPTLYAFDPTDSSVTQVEQQSATFDASPYTVSQFFATSADETKVPYFVVHRQDINLNGANPAHIFAYGGFRSSLTPSYSGSYEATNGSYGKLWLERGGVYVIANIRGGGEYGPEWHSAALRENRPRAFSDLEAVARDLASRQISSAEYTSIEGRSNGGLLTGAALVRHPELYSAVISGVPLLDMQRYHLLLAGASWMGEYGDPDSEDWNFIGAYSPYQNVRADVAYPPVFFYTSTRDDRVHPAHARKMAARMIEQGHEVYYYENLEGGHGGSVTNEQLAHRLALSYRFLLNALPAATPN
ncbi:prolyl oligopeptidase family serine peptidase [uncultured Umboniibacter sp.]|uniref:prolyl oligopeptidase family serine peptidase n=1 Tax=uncultured Umboniibacter sp. TaxID=1798917 RepID=UPI0026189DBA|nr:prolyl oligopeptidase family serine peptidase [uncultured Umboniibacter sp.]